MKYRDGEPCKHTGCLAHRTHPCEGCGRIGGKYINNISDEEIWKNGEAKTSIICEECGYDTGYLDLKSGARLTNEQRVREGCQRFLYNEWKDKEKAEKKEK